METPEFKFSSNLQKKTLIIELNGDITDSCEETIFAIYESHSASKFENLILDFSSVHYINSAGIAVLINLVTKTRQKEQHLIITNPSEYFLKIFTMIGLTRYSNIHKSIDEALANIGEENNS